MTVELRTGMTILDHDECWALLRQAEVARLAVSILNRPDIFPINYVVDHGRVVFRTAEGTKLAASVSGDAVAFEVDGFDATSGDAWSVVIKGAAVEVESMHDLLDAADLPLFPWHAAPKPRFVSIEPDEISGRPSTWSTRPCGERPRSLRGGQRLIELASFLAAATPSQR